MLREQAQQFEATQRHQEAITLYREILRRQPEQDDVRAALARLLSWQGSYAEAVDLYRDIIQRHPVDLDMRTALARVLSWQKQMTEAKSLYDAVVREDPRHAEALQGLADVLFWEGRSEEALPYYERAYVVSKDSALEVRIAAIRSELAEQEKRSSTGVQSSASKRKSEVVARARAWEEQAEYAQAIAAYQQALAEDPEDEELRGHLARTLAKAGQFEQATSLYREILARHPTDVDVQIELARVLAWQKQFDAAIPLYQQAVTQDSENQDALRGLADTLFWSGATQEALVHYSRLYRLTGDPDIAARVQALTASLETSPRAPLGLRESTVRLPYRDYLKVGYGQFSYTRGIPDERNALIEFSKSFGAQTLIGRVEPLYRFGFHDTPVSAELYSPLWRRAWGYVAAQGTINPHFSPNYSVVGEVSQGLGFVHPLLSAIEVSLGYRRLSYKTDDINLLMPGLTVFLPFNMWLTEKLYYVPETGAITLASRLTWHPTARLQLFASGSFGTSGERILATQDVTRISSRTIQGGVILPVTEQISLETTGYYEERGDLYVRRGGSFTIIYHW
jgi:YaiO family outer membrane protein